ncbi:hypothetical protein Taro_009886 [Colocasia esculenta]|uniref:Uncharacterized protein n=1 Tax=Colocasia esculenta TaxID=4460 RepID=A0A843U1R4_COLES|nr:hypothetical protein [Colocasia esculenta]
MDGDQKRLEKGKREMKLVHRGISWGSWEDFAFQPDVFWLWEKRTHQWSHQASAGTFGAGGGSRLQAFPPAVSCEAWRGLRSFVDVLRGKTTSRVVLRKLSMVIEAGELLDDFVEHRWSWGKESVALSLTAGQTKA